MSNLYEELVNSQNFDFECQPYMHLYLSQLSRYKKGDKFNAQSETVSSFGLKGGKFGERVIQEILGMDYARHSNICRIQRCNGKYYETDGYIQSLDIYIESKYMSFNSSGTAPEKLLYLFRKLEEYNKPTVLILGGMHETLCDEPSYEIWHAYHLTGKCKSKVVQGTIDSIRTKLFDIIKLSEFENWLTTRYSNSE